MTLVVVRALGLITIQDLGRPGHMHEAVPPGGALAPSRLIAANRAVRNPDDAPALEILGSVTVRASLETLVATDTLAAQTLPAGDQLTIASSHRVTYLALRGGVASPRILGGRGAMLSAGLGALVRADHALANAHLARVVPAPLPPAAPDDAPIRVIPGPDHASFTADALHTLVTSTYRIQPTSDRVGTRLAGPPLARSDAPDRSRPMVRGALEVPRDGQPIVLGPEHPTTGGYPVIAVIASADLDRLFSLPLGASVRFTR